MDRLQNTDLSATPPSATSGTTGYPRVSVPGGVAASAMHPYYLHMLIEELRAVIVAGGGTPAFTTLTQVQTAIASQITTATPDASTTVKGLVELATTAEAEAGVSATLAVTPAGLATISSNDYQSFTASGTWTKPTWATGDQLVIVEIWGAGGGGGANATGGGGGGGAYNRFIGKVSSLGATETVTIGAGGAAGAAGGNSSFGSLILAYGGGGGGPNASDGGGGGGGTRSVGTTNSGSLTAGQAGGSGYSGAAGVDGTDGAFDSGGGGGNGAGTAGGSSSYGGGGGGGGSAAGGNSLYGGAGGGATGGVSLHGGAGGAANTAGTAPGGGGGNGTGGAGARGECRVLVLRH